MPPWVGACTAVPDPECLPTVPCVTNEDCPNGHHCNEAIKPPACQQLYCGGFGSACASDVFCLSQVCVDDLCVSDCEGQECGPDPVYGESCGTCTGGKVCEEGQCVCEPEDHKGCCDWNICWIDSCGNEGPVIEPCPLACLNGQCVDCAAVGLADCSGLCKPLGTNSDCTACGDTCVDGEGCLGGECAVAIWTDFSSGLTWQNPPPDSGMMLGKAIKYCEELDLDSGGWHLPTIGELRTLIRGCPDTVTGGACGVTDSCLSESSCWSEVDCCGCSDGYGPAGGCYWPDEMQGSCSQYWSSSKEEDVFTYYFWIVRFNSGCVEDGYDMVYRPVRCVR